MKSLKIIIFVAVFLWTSSAWALEIYLKNGDKITGVVTADDGTFLLIQTVAAGEIKINKAFINFPRTYPQEYAPPKIVQQKPPVAAVLPAVQWKKDLSLGYTQMGGNSKSQLGQITADLNRKTASNEMTLKYDANYSSSNGVMTAKKFYGMLRYAYSFGSDLKWYNFYKVEGDQDYFADIYYRVTPSTGVGYWFSDTPDLKAMTEMGVGYQYTAYRIETTPNSGEAVLVPRFFIDKRLIGNLHLSEDFTFYPSLGDLQDYRFRSETDLVNQITLAWALKISYINDFNSNPPPSFKKDDYTWATSLQYQF